MGLFDLFKKKPAPAAGSTGNNGSALHTPVQKTTPDQVIAGLEKLGYFKFANPANIPQLKEELGKGLAEEHYLPGVAAGPPKYEGIDPRHYWLDNEDLFEQGGIIEKLEEMTSLFNKMNIKMDITGHVEDWNEETGLDHRITLNGKSYTIFEKYEGIGWGESAQRFADIVNDQLNLQNSDERLYLIHAANDGRSVFLTTEQYKLIRSLIRDINESPLPVKEWCEVMQVTWKNVTEQKQ